MAVLPGPPVGDDGMTTGEYMNAWLSFDTAEHILSQWLVPLLIGAGGVRLFGLLIGQRSRQ